MGTQIMETPMRNPRRSDRIEVFHDGECPLCQREVRFLRRRDRKGLILFTDIAAPDFDAQATGIPLEALMSRIHARLPDGRVVEGVEVFRRLYSLIGWSALVAPTRWPVIRNLLDLAYRLFARHRLRLTGRCQTDRCGLPSRAGSGAAP